jgi:chromosomal replication initiation ATPase DnaA
LAVQQQSLTFNPSYDYSWESYVPIASQNLAYQAIQRWPHWVDPILIICGPSFSGKTHLAHLWQQKTQGKFYDLKDPLPPNVPLIIDELQPGDLTENLFHLLNRLREEKRPCLMTAKEAPAFWPAPFADLTSRLKALMGVSIEEPTEKEQALLLQKILIDKQIILSPRKIRHLLLHAQRSYAGLKKIIETIG